MKRAIAAFLAGLVLATAGFAGAGGLSTHEKKQDLQIWQVRKVVRDLYHAQAYDSYRLDLLTCEPQPDCRGGVELAWQMLGDGWDGWPEK